MADTKVSALTAVSSVAGTNEFAVNESGTSKKATADQIVTFLGGTPAAASTSAKGKVEIAVQSEMEAGTDTGRAVVSGRQHFHPSAAKFWAKVTGNSTTILASYNMTSWADTGVGDADGTIATDFSSTTWAGLVSIISASGWSASVLTNAGFNAKAAGTFGVLCVNFTEGANSTVIVFDPDTWLVIGYGDFA